VLLRSIRFRSVLLPLLMVTSTAAPTPAMCVIDMGSNSFRRIVGSFERDRYTQRSMEQRTLGVGDDLSRYGRISEPKLAEIEAALASLKMACEKEKAVPIVAVGTAAFRDAPNGKRAVEIAAKLGIAMEIASERRESELAYLAGSLDRDGYAVIDNGSRSIELVSRAGGTLSHSVFNLGYRFAYDAFFANAGEPAAAVAALRDRLRSQAAKAAFMRGKKTLVGVEFGEMANDLFGLAAVEGRVLTLAQLKQTLEYVTTLAAGEFEALKKKKDMERALPRLVVAATLIEEFGYSSIVLTDRELGTGLIIEDAAKKRAVKSK